MKNMNAKKNLALTSEAFRFDIHQQPRKAVEYIRPQNLTQGVCYGY